MAGGWRAVCGQYRIAGGWCGGKHRAVRRVCCWGEACRAQMQAHCLCPPPHALPARAPVKQSPPPPPPTCSKATSESWGPGEASGWLCTVMALRPGCSMPAHVPSFRLIRLTCGGGKVVGGGWE